MENSIKGCSKFFLGSQLEEIGTIEYYSQHDEVMSHILNISELIYSRKN